MDLLKNKRDGSKIDRFLAEESELEQTSAIAIKKALVREMVALIRKENITRDQLAQRMGTSRATINRLLNPKYTKLTIKTKATHGPCLLVA